MKIKEFCEKYIGSVEDHLTFLLDVASMCLDERGEFERKFKTLRDAVKSRTTYSPEHQNFYWNRAEESVGVGDDVYKLLKETE